MDRSNINAEYLQLCPATRKDISDWLHRAVHCLVLGCSIHDCSRLTDYLIGNSSAQLLIGAILGIGLQQGQQHIHLEFRQHFLGHQSMRVRTEVDRLYGWVLNTNICPSGNTVGNEKLRNCCVIPYCLECLDKVMYITPLISYVCLPGNKRSFAAPLPCICSAGDWRLRCSKSTTWPAVPTMRKLPETSIAAYICWSAT